MLGALTNHLWQSTIFALAAALLTIAFRKNRAHVRYALWLAASLKFLVPFALLIALGTNLWQLLATKNSAPEIAAPAISQTIVQIAQPVSEALPFTATPHATNWLLIALVAVWACGCLAIGLMRFRAWFRIRAALHSSARIELPSAVEVRSAPGLLEPGVVGIFRPKLLLPDGILESLTPPQLEAVLAHELAHIRRRDNLTAALHMLVEAVFWFHPLVWWIGARLIEERERACDEAVLSLGNQPRDYAEAIVQVCKLYVESPLVCVSGVTGADLKIRIRSILTNTGGIEMTRGRKIVLVISAAGALALPVAIGIVASPQLRAQSAHSPSVSFEVASIKPNKSGAVKNFTGIKSPGTFTAENVTLKGLIMSAYDVRAFQVIGGPHWIDSDRFDITAKPRVDINEQKLRSESRAKQWAEMAIMLQSLLADRFDLKLHREMKEQPVFALRVAKGGPRLKQSDCIEYDPNNPPPKPPPGQRLNICGDSWQGRSGANRTIDGTGITMADLTKWGLATVLGNMVLDETGLNGKFDVHLVWAPDDLSTNISGDPKSEKPVDSSNSEAPSLFSAIQQQLGLKVESTRAPVATLVVEQAEKPSRN